MPELPWRKWFPQDWASDPFLSMCDIASQGVWINAVNAMMLTDQPRIEGTVEELARVCRCRPTQLQAALVELKSKHVGNIRQQGVNTVIECRRLLREFNIKELRRKAGLASATKRQQTTQHDVPTEGATPSVSVSVSEYVSNGTRVPLGKESEENPLPRPPHPPSRMDIPTIEAVKLHAVKIGLTEREAEKFYAYWESAGWRRKSGPMRSWQASLTTWKMNWEEKGRPGINGHLLPESTQIQEIIPLKTLKT